MTTNLTFNTHDVELTPTAQRLITSFKVALGQLTSMIELPDWLNSNHLYWYVQPDILQSSGPQFDISRTAFVFCSPTKTAKGISMEITYIPEAHLNSELVVLYAANISLYSAYVAKKGTFSTAPNVNSIVLLVQEAQKASSMGNVATETNVSGTSAKGILDINLDLVKFFSSPELSHVNLGIHVMKALKSLFGSDKFSRIAYSTSDVKLYAPTFVTTYAKVIEGGISKIWPYPIYATDLHAESHHTGFTLRYESHHMPADWFYKLGITEIVISGNLLNDMHAQLSTVSVRTRLGMFFVYTNGDVDHYAGL